mmetsp:Transcript_158072/g.503302  ORF Transcript_158072/g.503302 Transcript_158072/m.503302 type:complete len:262 (-) Transcript_158072:198-983(-)
MWSRTRVQLNVQVEQCCNQWCCALAQRVFGEGQQVRSTCHDFHRTKCLHQCRRVDCREPFSEFGGGVNPKVEGKGRDIEALKAVKSEVHRTAKDAERGVVVCEQEGANDRVGCGVVAGARTSCEDGIRRSIHCLEVPALADQLLMRVMPWETTDLTTFAFQKMLSLATLCVLASRYSEVHLRHLTTAKRLPCIAGTTVAIQPLLETAAIQKTLLLHCAVQEEVRPGQRCTRLFQCKCQLVASLNVFIIWTRLRLPSNPPIF